MFKMPWIEISIVLSIIFGIPALIKFYVWLKDRQRQSIRNLDYFLDQAILTLRSNVTYEGFRLPEGFNYWHGISANDRTVSDFSRLKPWLGWKIKRYRIFCDQIDAMIRHFRDRAIEHGIIHSIHTSDGQEYVLTDEYEEYSEGQLSELLENEGLIRDKELIEKTLRRLANKSPKLLNKFEKLRTKWRRT